MWYEDVTNDWRQRASHSHAIFLLEELRPFKKDSSQTSLKQLHSGINTQEGPFWKYVIIMEITPNNFTS
jgi:hypothetical protein